MNLLSSTTIPFRGPAESMTDEREPGIFTTIANDSYIAVSFSDSSIHILCAQTGSPVLKNPIYQTSDMLISGMAFAEDSLIFSCAKTFNIQVFDIPSE